MDRKNNLRECRLKKGFTLKQLAQKTGYEYSYLVRLEKGLCKGTPNTWVKLARVLEITTNDLLKEKIAKYYISAK